MTNWLLLFQWLAGLSNATFALMFTGKPHMMTNTDYLYLQWSGQLIMVTSVSCGQLVQTLVLILPKNPFGAGI